MFNFSQITTIFNYFVVDYIDVLLLNNNL